MNGGDAANLLGTPRDPTKLCAEAHYVTSASADALLRWNVGLDHVQEQERLRSSCQNTDYIFLLIYVSSLPDHALYLVTARASTCDTISNIQKEAVSPGNAPTSPALTALINPCAHHTERGAHPQPRKATTITLI